MCSDLFAEWREASVDAADMVDFDMIVVVVTAPVECLVTIGFDRIAASLAVDGPVRN